MPSASANPASEPVVSCGSGAPKIVLASDIVAAATVAVPLLRPSAPRQFAAMTGVTLYCHCPAGTLVSTQLVATMVPEQPPAVVCSEPPAAS